MISGILHLLGAFYMFVLGFYLAATGEKALAALFAFWVVALCVKGVSRIRLDREIARLEQKVKEERAWRKQA
jgi:hypothetical protein